MKINEKLLKNIAKKGSAFVLAGTLLLGSNLVAVNDNNVVFAAEQEQNEVVNLNVQVGINLYLDDKGFIPTDANGNETYPFISEGTTYVPIRAIAELFNADIKWDQKNKIAEITTNNQSTGRKHTILKKQEKTNIDINATKGVRLIINGKECIPKDVNGNIKDIYVVNGTTYVPIRAVSEALNLPVAWSDVTNSVFIGKHKNYGLTVENINDPKTFIEYSEKFCTFPYEIWTYQEELTGTYRATDQYEASRFYMYLLNEEYCSDELLQEVFKDCEHHRFHTFVNVANIFAARINSLRHYEETRKPYLFEYAVIDENKMKYLSDFQDASWELHKTGDYSKAKDIAFDYLYGNGVNSFNEKENLITGMIITCWAAQSEARCLENSEEWDFYGTKLTIINELSKKAEELYQKVYAKQLTK